METKFQTSFIPKKSISTASGGLTPQIPGQSFGGGTSIYMVIAIVIFVGSLLSVGGIYAWKQYLSSAQVQYEKDLNLRHKEFNIDQIVLIKAQSTKIALAQKLLRNHLIVSKIFSVLSGMTTESVRLLTMDLTVPVGTSDTFQLAVTGYGKNYPAVAFQSDVLNSLEKYGLRSVVQNGSITNPALNLNGTVSFGMTAQIDSSGFSYLKNLEAPTTQNLEATTSDSTN